MNKENTLTRECLDAMFKEGKRCLKKNHCWDGTLFLTIHKGIYEHFTPEEWCEYIKRHNNEVTVKVVDTDNDKTYIVDSEGNLKYIEPLFEYYDHIVV